MRGLLTFSAGFHIVCGVAGVVVAMLVGVLGILGLHADPSLSTLSYMFVAAVAGVLYFIWGGAMLALLHVGEKKVGKIGWLHTPILFLVFLMSLPMFFWLLYVSFAVLIIVLAIWIGLGGFLGLGGGSGGGHISGWFKPD